jgi:thymidylate synthase (FAD)
MSTRLVLKLIARTEFLGVPEELIPQKDGSKVFIMNQDMGTDSARLIECAGRNCYDSYGQGRSSTEYHKHILDVAHGSVAAHANFSFYIQGISRGLSHELVRHGVGTATSQRSTRYCDESESDWVPHPLLQQLWETDPQGEERIFARESKAAFYEVKEKASEAYNYICSVLQKWLVHRGIDKATARKQARGAARGVLGNALETSMVWTANVRALRNVIEQRASPFADAEIRLFGNALLAIMQYECPEYFSDYKVVPTQDGIGFGVETEHRKI